ncbi:DNA-3-methyladenine glycosylase [Cellulomonas sp. SLBN-39]|uniref:DNA-3-methyladenine glycosylase n=1 Tax=Cellulomonas sp. SLBN-39 TaxID=2768446 RepID=UPI001174C654|nr:DNA-3-methyladenine glycosylase [Cellulomonas sp. SLBN-39]TQL04393.1 DNA-3-methyladenine glycosylase [Cellulomonas sp. SLBN-39]
MNAVQPEPAGDDAAAPGVGRVPARTWFARDVLTVARDLLGAFVSAHGPDGTVTVRLTEVEAYGGDDDPASHAFRGRNARNAAMFAEPGRLYVYRHLGLHHCVNVVTQPAGSASAVLLRAGEVVEGKDLAWDRRARAGTVDNERQLARGPARLAVCLGLDVAANGQDVTEPGGAVVVHLRETDSVLPPVVSGARVGVSGAGGDVAAHPWRLWFSGDRTVSAFRPGYRSPTSADAPRGATTSA